MNTNINAFAKTGEAPLLEIRDLRIEAANGPIVDGVGLSVRQREMVGIVGESGCGKTVTALAIMALLPRHAIQVTNGRIMLMEEDLLRKSDAEMEAIRGERISMIFQEPMTSLNPVIRIGDQISEVLEIHRGIQRSSAKEHVERLLAMVGLPSEQQRRYPFQLSGGQRQRVMIAMALACEPDLLIADEPTTALDVTVQAQILDLIKRMQVELGMGCILVTHDLGVVAEICDRALVMYAGRIVESGSITNLFSAPMHRYTKALLETIPAANQPGSRLPAIAGMVPPPGARLAGCAFAERCAAATERCRSETPPAVQRDEHVAFCWNPAQ